MPQHKLCKVSDLEDPGSRGFSIELNSETLELFIVKINGEVVGYQNICPHTGIGLDWMPHRFLNLDQTLIICATHGALFQIDNGLCISGPCRGKKLSPLCIETIDDELFLIEN